MQNQLSRRNLNDFQRIELVRKCENAVKAQAKARQGTRTNISNIQEKFPERCKTEKQSRDELGAMAGVSRSTYEHATAVLDKAPEPVIEATRRKELSINAAYGVTKLPESQQAEIAQRIAEGGNPRSVIADTKRKNKTRSHNSDNMLYWNAIIKHAEQAALDGRNIHSILKLIDKASDILKSALKS